MSKEILDTRTLPKDFRAVVEADPYADTSYLHQEGWGDRLRAYEAGDFAFCSVILEQRCTKCDQWHTVGSLSGIEHDGTQAAVGYLEEVAMELHGEV